MTKNSRGTGERSKATSKRSAAKKSRTTKVQAEHDEPPLAAIAADEYSTPPVVVGIGASAGGLAALTELVAKIPRTSRFAYVIAQHLSPTHSSHLGDLLRSKATLEVEEITDGVVPVANTIYVTPPNHDVAYVSGCLKLLEPAGGVGPRPSVDLLFQSLADAFGDRSIGIVLSGAGFDGAAGVRAIKSVGGVTVAQEPATARHDSMPHAAITTGCVDLILAPAQIWDSLANLADETEEHDEVEGDDETMRVFEGRIAEQVRRHCRFDLNHYKPTTVWRRVRRRMAVRKVSRIEEYSNLLLRDPAEAKNLMREVLISVTSFFRDPPAFEALRNALRKAFANRKNDEVFRVWVAATATGEEAYTIAILLSELRRENPRAPEFLIFATDLDEQAINFARSGSYGESSVMQLPEAIRNRYFDRDGKNYQIKKFLRQATVFATQNVLEDPPFSRMDLISCRNLLIYFNAETQKKVMGTFHYSLNREGLLLLGSSESSDLRRALFTEIDRSARLFQRIDAAASRRQGIVSRPGLSRAAEEMKAAGGRHPADLSTPFAQVNDELMSAYCPPAVVIDAEDQIVHFIGDLNQILSLPKGRAQLRVYEMVPEAMRPEIRAMVQRCRRDREPATGAAVEMRINGEARRVRPVVRLSSTPNAIYVLLAFETVTEASGHPGVTEADRESKIIVELERELMRTRQHLQTVVEELEGANEELQSQAEELQSSNEELQSTNEELQTSNEEMQSTNEELLTVNDELKAKSVELELLSADLHNIRNSLDFPLIVVDEKIEITQINDSAQVLVEGALPPQGGSLATVDWRIDMVPMLGKVREVMRSRSMATLEVHDGERHYELRCMPYLFPSGAVGGAILAFIDVSERHEAARLTREREALYRLTFDSSGAGSALFDLDQRFLRVSDSFARMVGLSSDALLQRRLHEIVDPASEQMLERSMKTLRVSRDSAASFEEQIQLIGPEPQWVEMTAALVRDARGQPTHFIAQFHDITARRANDRVLADESRRLKLLSRIAEDIGRHDDFYALMSVSVEGLAEAYPTATGTLFALDASGRLVCTHVFGGASDYVPQQPLSAEDLAALRGSSAESQMLVFNDDALKRVQVPVMEGSSLIGAMLLQRHKLAWSAADQLTLHAAAELIAGGHRDAKLVQFRQDEMQALVDEKERAEFTLHAIGEGVVTTNAAGVVTYINSTAEDLLSVHRQKAIGRHVREIFKPVSASSGNTVVSVVERCLAEQRPVEQTENDTFLWMADGRRTMIKSSAAPLRNRHANLLGAVLVVRDVTSEHLLTEELTYRAAHDPLTGLSNRIEFERQLKSAYDDAKRQNQTHMLCYLDLDNFKVINDTSGHGAGDELLKQLATKLRLKMRKADTLSRLGGDEFGVIFRGCSVEQGLQLAHALLEVVSELKFSWEDKVFSVGVSIGAVAIDLSADSVADLLARVDAACYMAKEQGRNAVYHSQKHDDRISKRFGEMHVVSQITQAIDTDRLKLYSEPVVDVSDSETVHYRELLVRMLDTQSQLQLPVTFIPAAERYYLMGPIDRWVVDRALRGLSEARSRGVTQKVGINLSGQTLSDARFADYIERKMDEYAVDPESIYFELTETAAITHLTETANLMRRLSAKGISFALDDFGTGMSSFAYLRKLPVHLLKIDGVFLRASAPDNIDRPLIEAMARVARELGMKTVAEHVERPMQIAVLRDLGVDFVQGFAVGKAKPWPGV